MRCRGTLPLMLWLTGLGGLCQAQVTHLVSKSTAGVVGDRSSQLSSLCASGRRVAFASEARNLVPDDTNFVSDVFVHDRRTGETVRVSVDSQGAESNGFSGFVLDLSADGDHVVFLSAATNLVAGDTNGEPDLFVHDLVTGSTERVSVASDGTQANGLSFYASISGDGRLVAFDCDADNLVPGDTNRSLDVFLHDRQTGLTTRVSVASDGTQANAGSNDPCLSADGRFVSFTSRASNLVPGDTNGVSDVFLHDLLTGETVRVGAGNRASRDSTLSADGRTVAFSSEATNLVPGDTNGREDVFLHDARLLLTWRASVSSAGEQAADGDSGDPVVSEDGRAVAFLSDASNLVEDDDNQNQDVFVFDRVRRETRRVSVSSLGQEANQNCWHPGLGADGRQACFASAASNLDPVDSGPWMDLFVHGPALTLEVAPRRAALGDAFSLTTWTGLAGMPAVLCVTRVDDTFFPFRLALGRFAGNGEWQVDLQVPVVPAYQGIDLAFQAWALGADGRVVATNEDLLAIR